MGSFEAVFYAVLVLTTHVKCNIPMGHPIYKSTFLTYSMQAEMLYPTWLCVMQGGITLGSACFTHRRFHM